MNGWKFVCICIRFIRPLLLLLNSRRYPMRCEVVFLLFAWHYKNIRYCIWWAEKNPLGAYFALCCVVKARNKRSDMENRCAYLDQKATTRKGGMWSIKTNCLRCFFFSLHSIFIHINRIPLRAASIFFPCCFVCAAAVNSDIPGYIYDEASAMIRAENRW